MALFCSVCNRERVQSSSREGPLSGPAPQVALWSIHGRVHRVQIWWMWWERKQLQDRATVYENMRGSVQSQFWHPVYPRVSDRLSLEPHPLRIQPEFSSCDLQSAPRGKFKILGCHSIGHSKEKRVYVHVRYSELFPRYRYFTVQFQNCW
jgi:hypothetical protein